MSMFPILSDRKHEFWKWINKMCIFLPWHQSGYRTGRPGCARFPSLWMRKLYNDEQRRYFGNTRRQPQTFMPDNGFIMLEGFQNKAGTGQRAWPDTRSSCWRRGLAEGIHKEPGGGGALLQTREWKLHRHIDQNFTSWCPETPRKMYYIFLT